MPAAKKSKWVRSSRRRRDTEAFSHSTMQNVTLIHRMRLFSPFHKKEIEPIKYPVDKYFSQKGTRRQGERSRLSRSLDDKSRLPFSAVFLIPKKTTVMTTNSAHVTYLYFKCPRNKNRCQPPTKEISGEMNDRFFSLTFLLHLATFVITITFTFTTL